MGRKQSRWRPCQTQPRDAKRSDATSHVVAKQNDVIADGGAPCGEILSGTWGNGIVAARVETLVAF